MQRRTILFVLLAVLIVPVLYAADTGTSMKSSTEVNGTIDQIDLKTMTLTVKVQPTGTGEPELKVFTFDDKTSFKRLNAGKSEAIKAQDLKAGDNVSLKADSSNLATDVHLESAPPSPGATQDQPEQKQEQKQE